MDSTYWTLFHSCISVNRKTWEDRFAGKVGGCGVLRNGENPSNRGDDFEMGGGGDTPLQTMIADTSTSSLYSVLLIFMVFDFRFTPGVWCY